MSSQRARRWDLHHRQRHGSQRTRDGKHPASASAIQLSRRGAARAGIAEQAVAAHCRRIIAWTFPSISLGRRYRPRPIQNVAEQIDCRVRRRSRNDLPRVLAAGLHSPGKDKDKPSLVHIVSTREVLCTAPKTSMSSATARILVATPVVSTPPMMIFQKLGWDINKTKYGKLNDAAIADYAAWVPRSFRRQYSPTRGYRVAPADRGPGEIHVGCGRRWCDHEEDISFHPTRAFAIWPCMMMSMGTAIMSTAIPKMVLRCLLKIVMEHGFGVAPEDLAVREQTPELEQAFEWLEACLPEEEEPAPERPADDPAQPKTVERPKKPEKATPPIIMLPKRCGASQAESGRTNCTSITI